MQIKDTSTKILKELYSQFNKESYSLKVECNLEKLAVALSVSKENINQYLFYLYHKGLLKGSEPLWNASTQTVEFVLTPEAIDLVGGMV